jgi:mRNA interferase MazF
MAGRTSVKRYHIYLARLEPTVGSEVGKTCPVVIVSDDLFNKHLEVVVTCPLTTSLHPTWRGRIQIVCAGKAAEIAVDQIRTISKGRLIRRIDELSNDEAFRLRLMITEMYGES